MQPNARSTVSAAIGWALVQVGRLGNDVRPTDLARELDVTGASLVRLLDQMAAAELIERHRDQVDARVSRVRLTTPAAPRSRHCTTLGGGATLARPYGTGSSLPGSVGYDIGLGLAYPLDLSGKIRRGIEAARGDAEAVAAARDNVRVTVATAADQAGKLYRFGRTDFLSLLTAQAALATAEANLTASDALLVDRQVDVFEALGGGWQS